MILLPLLLCFSFTRCENLPQVDKKLVFSHVIFRHGDRTIRNSYPNDPYKDKVHWPEGFGQLTKLGKQRQYKLGQFLRRRYDEFLGTHSPDKISVVSSGFDRTINSANLVLAGLFPPKNYQIWNQDLLWQPIAVHSIPKEIDYFIHAEACDQFNKAHKKFQESLEVKSLINENRWLFEYVEEHSGKSIRTIEAVKDFYETLLVESELNKTLPAWTKDIFIPGGALEGLTAHYYKFLTGTTELKRLKSGFLLKDILDRFRSKVRSSLPDQIMQIYSGHDITVASLLNSLGVFTLHRPPYSACVLFELYESGSNHFVQLFYKNSTSEDLKPLSLPRCGTKCSLNDLYELYSDILPSSIESEC